MTCPRRFLGLLRDLPSRFLKSRCRCRRAAPCFHLFCYFVEREPVETAAPIAEVRGDGQRPRKIQHVFDESGEHLSKRFLTQSFRLIMLNRLDSGSRRISQNLILTGPKTGLRISTNRSSAASLLGCQQLSQIQHCQNIPYRGIQTTSGA